MQKTDAKRYCKKHADWSLIFVCNEMFSYLEELGSSSNLASKNKILSLRQSSLIPVNRRIDLG